METIRSADGTTITFNRTGNGPSIVLVHGNGDVHKFWKMAQVSSVLEKNFTVHAIDRRGRGNSGDGDTATYKLELEAEDLSAVIDWINEPVTLLGHSGGALYSLEAALKNGNIRNLILYEPPIKVGEYELDVEEELIKMKKLLDQKKNEQALVLFFSDIAGLTKDEINQNSSMPIWQDMVNAAHTLPRELKAITEYEFDSSRFEDMTTPTLLLSGSESPPLYKSATEAVNDVLPDSRISVFNGQGHMAMITATDQFIDEVLRFAR